MLLSKFTKLAPRSMSAREKLFCLSITIFICVFLSVFVNLNQGVDIVYTHVFYLPIIMASLWYGYKAMYLAGALGLLHIFINYELYCAFIPSSVYRALIFLLITYLLCRIGFTPLSKKIQSSDCQGQSPL